MNDDYDMYHILLQVITSSYIYLAYLWYLLFALEIENLLLNLIQYQPRKRQTPKFKHVFYNFNYAS